MRRARRDVLRRSGQIGGLLLVLLLGSPAAAQRLLDQQPFDQITLNAANDDAVLQVLPLELPMRRLPKSPRPTESLQVRLVEQPDEIYVVAWRDIEEVKLYEQLLLDEAASLESEGQFNEAYENYQYLLDTAPDTPGVAAALERYLLRNAGASYEAGRLDDALSLLLELFDRNPQHPQIAAALDRIASRLVQQYADAGQYQSARSILQLESGRLADLDLSATARWRQTFTELASEKVAAAQEQLASDNLRQARSRIREALAIQPDLPEAVEAAREIQRAARLVVVGVATPPSSAGDRIDDWAARRTNRLRQRRLFELRGYTADGAQYVCPLGAIERSGDGRGLTLALHRSLVVEPSGSPLTGYVAARRLLSGSEKSVFEQLTVEDVFSVKLALRQAPLRPEPPLASAWDAPSAAESEPAAIASMRPYELTEQSQGETVFELSEAYFATGDSQPKLVVEQQFSDSEAAREAIESGQVDMLDRVAPWSLQRLSGQESLVVARYALPTVHVLIPVGQRPLLRTREFRRALVYAIPRQAIVEEILQQGDAQAGTRVLGGVFARGSGFDDPAGYASDPQITPRPFDPKLAAILAAVARRGLPGSDSDNVSGGEPAPLVVAHRADPVIAELCRIVCERLSLAGISATPREMDREQLPSDVDLYYAELAIWEPVSDAARVFGFGGLVQSPGTHLSQTLLNLKQAQSWAQAREHLHQIDRIVHEQLPLIPLWQCMNHFAYRRGIGGIPDRPVVLYQDIEQWNVDELTLAP
ncbi:MAG: ABC transporter substrate-binding protein [Pirellulales bacterium]